MAEKFYPKDNKISKNSSNPNIPQNLSLNKINEEEDKYSSNEEDEKLGYNSNYKLNQKNKSNTDIQLIEDISLKSKASTVSTSVSQNEVYLESNHISPLKINSETNMRRSSYSQYQNPTFIRQRLNSTPVTNYFQGMEYYLRGKEPEKNDYQKSLNYIEKEKFYKLSLESMNMKYKSFDLSEQKKFLTNQYSKMIDDTDIKINNNNLVNNPQGKINQINIENKIQNSTINNINIINNQPMIMQLPLNYDNNNGLGKFDMPIYYLRYCDFESKYKFFIFKIFLFYRLQKWYTNIPI